MVGDQASQSAFRKLLARWRKHFGSVGRDPFGPKPISALSRKEVDELAKSGSTDAMRTVAAAVNEFADRLAGVIQRFLRDPSWAEVERIVVGGGFKESEVGRLAIRLAASRLAEQGSKVDLRLLHHSADDGGLLGWAHLAPGTSIPRVLAVDIGGTNVRCGIVVPGDASVGGPPFRVVARKIWKHAEDEPGQEDLVEGIVAMLRGLVTEADQRDLVLDAFVGVGCPGLICKDGSIERGADNLPGDWARASFHLPRRIAENLPRIAGKETTVAMHNDAVVQGLSELPYIRDVKRWAVFTIGTGLGNASYTNLRPIGRPP